MRQRLPAPWTLSQLMTAMLHQTGHTEMTIKIADMQAIPSSCPTRISIDEEAGTVTVTAGLRPTSSPETPEKAGPSDHQAIEITWPATNS